MTLFLLLCFLVVTLFGFGLRALDLRHLRRFGHRVPPGFEASIRPELLEKTSRYVFESARVGVVESILDKLLLAAFLFGGLLPVYDRWISSLSESFVISGLLFFLGLLLIETGIGIPFSLVRNFVVEKRFGFNRMSPALWLVDLLKTLLISVVLFSAAGATALWLVGKSPDFWWLWAGLFFLALSIFLMYISPYVIEPLFFKFEPLRIEGLEGRIRDILGKAGLHIRRVFQVDASRRSGHSNAYFSGIGRVKRIVLFDTLLDQMNEDEILAVLAHEAGHWKKRHILKRLILTELFAFAGLFTAHHLVNWDGLPGLIGAESLSFAGQLVVVAFLGTLLLFPFSPLLAALSRRDEREADRFATELTGNPESLASALIKLSKENLSNLHPHPLYAAFHYSHPPVVERVNALRSEKRRITGDR